MNGYSTRRSTTLVVGLTLMLAPLWMAHGQQLAAPSLASSERLMLSPSTHGGHLLLSLPEKPDVRPAWLMSSLQVGKLRVPAPSVAMVGAAAIAGGVGCIFGLQSRSQIQDMHSATVWGDKVARHGEALKSAQKANLLFGTAALLTLGAVVTGWTSSSGGSSHVEVVP